MEKDQKKEGASATLISSRASAGAPSERLSVTSGLAKPDEVDAYTPRKRWIDSGPNDSQP